MKTDLHILAIISLLLVLSFKSYSQSKDLECGLDVVVKKHYAAISSYNQRNNAKIASNATLTEPVTIPVVVHIVWHEAVQNITDAQVKSQIDALNRDFRKLNSDIINVPAVFRSYATDSKINFCLASIDPNGNYTSGITRTYTPIDTIRNGGNDSYVKYSDKGGYTAWNTDNYLNIWVCNFDIKGLGTPPIFDLYPKEEQGVTVRYNVFGTKGEVLPDYNMGRTCVHEVGHFFSLWHLIGIGAEPCGDDLCEDTPTQQEININCPSFPEISTCSGTSNGPNGDMFMNFMEYTYHQCRLMFTADQVIRMQNTVSPGGERYSLTIAKVINPITTKWKQTNGPSCGENISCVVSNGTEILVGTYYKGIFLSTNNGTNWSSINNGLSSNGLDIYINALAINENNIYACLNGVLFLSTNNGLNWSSIHEGLTGLYVTSIVANGAKIFVGTDSYGVYLSGDYGKSWTAVNNGLPYTDITSLTISGTSIFAGSMNYGLGVYRSTDNGNNWTAVNNGLPPGYNFIRTITASGSKIFTSLTDGAGVFLSTDNGDNWNSVNNGLTKSIITALAINGNTIYAGSEMEGVYVSNDNGNSWNGYNNGLLDNTEVISMAVCGNNIFSGSNRGMFKSTNTGTSWSTINNGFPSSSAITTMLINGSKIFAGSRGMGSTTDYPGMFLSADNGKNWTAIENGLTNKNISSIVMSGNHIFVGTYGGGIFLSDNDGTSWAAVNNGLPINSSICSLAINGANIFAGTSNGMVYLSTNNGGTWNAVIVGLPKPKANNRVNALAIKGNYIYAGIFWEGLYVSADNGGSWSSVGINSYIYSLYTNGSNIFVGTRYAIISSSDNGLSWSQFNTTGYGTCSFVKSGTNIFAGTSEGVYLSTDNGNSWTLHNDSLLNINVLSLAICGNNIFAGTDGGGVWIRPLSDMISLPLVYPKITLNSSTLNAGQSITITGSDFSANGDITLKIVSNNGFSQSKIVTSQANGGFTYSFMTNTSMAAGIYNVSATDLTSGKSTISKSFQLVNNINPTNAHIEIIYPKKGLSLFASDKINIEWQDIMAQSKSYTISGSKRNYKYLVEYSSDNGVSWHTVNTVQGSEYINAIKTFQIPATFTIVGDNYVVRVTDYFNNTNSDMSDNFSVVNQTTTATNIKAELKWDYSYADQNNDLYGVAADGAARVYMVVSKINNGIGASISNVSVKLTDGLNTSVSTLGKVLAATKTSSYDIEANTANSLTATQNSASNSGYWFWYVAPDDFAGNDPNDVKLASRKVMANFTINYSDGKIETFDKSIQIVRPPLCFAHGLASDPSAWNNFRHNDLGYDLNFLSDSRFYTKIAIKLDAKSSFNLNAFYLTHGDNQNSLHGVISDLRNKGYATNRCDYIAHSMGGSILRYALDHYSNYFYRSGTSSNLDYQNYGQGYVNKFVTINTPHNGSPWADILNRYTPDLTVGMRLALQLDYNNHPNSLPFSFITQDNPDFLIPKFKIVDAVRDLQIDQNEGGVDFGTTNLKTHLIATDFFEGIQNTTSNMIPQGIINLVDQAADEVDFLNKFLELTIAEEQDRQLVSDLVEVTDTYDNPVQTALQYIERMADLYNTAMFIPESDLVVSVSSQLAGYPRIGSTNVTVFDKYHIGHAFIRPVLGSIDAGNAVNDLLNTSVNSDAFNIINASNNKKQKLSLNAILGEKSNTIVISPRDTLKLKIISPVCNSQFFTDSTLNIRILLSDTVNLISYKVKFQNKTYRLPKTAGITDLNIQVNSNLLDRNYIFAEAFFKYADSSCFYYDTVSINVITNSQLIGFSATPKIIYLSVTEAKTPDYVGYFNDFITSAANFSPMITSSVDNSSVVTFNPLLKSFTGVSTGETFAIVSYKGLSDTIYFVVNELNADSIETEINEPLYPAQSNGDSFNITIYPNPSKGDFTIATKEKDCELSVFNVLGEAIISQKIQNEKTEIDLSKQPNGIYLLHFYSKNGSVTKKIIVRK